MNATSRPFSNCRIGISTRLAAPPPSLSPFLPDIIFFSSGRLTSTTDSSLHRRAGFSSMDLGHSRELPHPSLATFNLHKPRVRRVSGFLLTAFSNATPHTSLRSQRSITASRPKRQ
jgi:hypothetical protein